MTGVRGVARKGINMEKRTVIGVCIVIGSAVLLMMVWFGFRIWQNTAEANTAAEEFSALLQEGELKRLTLQCYAYQAGETEYLQDGEGNVQVVAVTPQQMAQFFGMDAVAKEWPGGENGDGRKEDTEEKELLKILMSYSRISVSVGLTWGQYTSMNLLLEGPDMQSWEENLTVDELLALLSISEGLGEQIEKMLADGKIPMRAVQIQVPMLKQDGKWKFQVTEEMEQIFYGGSGLSY